MIAASPLIAFIPTRNIAQARSFYEDVLGLRFVGEDGFAAIMEANGTMVRIARVQEFVPAAYTIFGWKVANIRSEIAELCGRGVSFIRYSDMQQSEEGIWTAPSGAQIAWFRDPDGNVLSLTQF